MGEHLQEEQKNNTLAYDVEQPHTQNSLLKLGYSSLLLQRWPINNEFHNCSSPESAYFLYLEKTYCTIPEHLEWDTLKKDIPEKHHERMSAIWGKVCEHKKKLEKHIRAYRNKLETTPTVVDDEISAIMRSTPLRIEERFSEGIATVILNTDNKDGMVTVEAWQCEEKGLREQIFKEHKTYLVALRLYYEMLLENEEYMEPHTTTDGTELSCIKECVLPENHPERMNIVVINRYLRIIDAAYQAVAAAKGAHHNQTKRKLRKTGHVPYVSHTIDVLLQLLYDTIPYFVEEPRLNYEPVTFSSVAPVHDVTEDTALTVISLFEGFINRLTDKYDSSLDQVIRSGFEKHKNDDPKLEIIENSPEDIKKRILDLLGKRSKATMKRIMRIVTNNEPLSNKEKKKALVQSTVPTEFIRETFEISDNDLRDWRISIEDCTQEKHRMYSHFPEEYDKGKISTFIIRLESIPSDTGDKHSALMLKMEDRAHNISTLNGMPQEKQRDYIRATITRMIAYVMEQTHTEQFDEFPLYNTTARLIDTTLNEYERLFTTHSEILEETDVALLEQLRTWKIAVKRYEVPQKIQEVINEYLAGSIRQSQEVSVSDSSTHSRPNIPAPLAFADTADMPVDPRLKELADKNK